MSSATYRAPAASIARPVLIRSSELRQFAFLAVALALEFTTMLVG